MSVRCPQCSYTLEEKNLPRFVGARILCPRCKTPMVVPEMTVPFMDQAAVATLESSKASKGALSADKKYAVVVINGKRPGRVFPIEKPRVTIGRIGCDIVLDDPELSRQHALIAINGTRARLEDLGSTNGTYVGERRIEQAELEDRSEFRVGNHQLVFVMAERGL
ncbi:MAG: FHA domain-containing protein [Acidobacteriota bacterium]